jgi:hypothetical protein
LTAHQAARIEVLADPRPQLAEVDIDARPEIG